MSSRPEILFPLFSSLDALDGVGPKTAKILAGLNVNKPRDLLFTLPNSCIDRRRQSTILGADLPQVLTVEVEIKAHRKPDAKGRPYKVKVSDAKASFELVFFHSRVDWLEQQLPIGQRRVVSGRVELYDGIGQMPHPDHIALPADVDKIPLHEPIYPLTAGLTQRQMSKAMNAALARIPDLSEWISPALMSSEGWPAWSEALNAAHHPVGQSELDATTPARQRLAYDELFAHQLTLALARAAMRRAKGVPTIATDALQSKVRAALPYRPTMAQDRAVEEIAADMAQAFRMNRLLQGDVGSGKTFVALMALLIAVEAGGQGVLMAPTDILARQHLEALRPLAEAAGIALEILTGRDKGARRQATIEALARGDIHILVGTHAVFQPDVEFRDLRLAVIDEQHRFGVAQRMELGAKGRAADVLVMTATPIPRSLSLAQYGDMDVSTLDEKPPGRKPITTAIVSSARMGEVVDRLRKVVAEGRQAYWVCPLVEESEVRDMTSAEERFKLLKAAFDEGVVGLVHGQMPPSQRDAAMEGFIQGKTRVLVATTVIEVGVDVPDASIMVVERAESFGLAQLHQLRGRVGRGDAASTCLLMYQAPLSEGGNRRLGILRETENGFRIAEEDLAMRGSGDLIGVEQSGLPSFRIADLERQSALMELAQSDARQLLDEDPKLESARGRAARILLWLTEQDKAIRLISIG